jgi:hypothetical protein
MIVISTIISWLKELAKVVIFGTIGYMLVKWAFFTKESVMERLM